MPDLVVVHPLVLLSIVDHYNRVARDTRKRVVGVLLGEVHKGRVDITNSFAVPFEEDDRNPKIWFLDHSYVEAMFDMFRKVNAKERVVGWYSTGPRLKGADLDISDLIGRYCDSPLLVICEVQAESDGLPTTAYYAKEEVREDGTQKSQKVFTNVPTEVGATEAEEIGVEHLLRDVKDSTIGTLATEMARMVRGVRGLRARLGEVQQYLQLVLDGQLPVNHDIMYQLQDVFNLLPNLSVSSLVRSFAVKSNDMMLVVYLASMIRSVLALHNLISNKEQRQYHEQQEAEGRKKEQNQKEGKADTGKGGAKPIKNGTGAAAKEKNSEHKNGST